MDQLELVWLAGLLEGEGSFLAGPPSSPGNPGISIQMTDEDVISHVANLLGVKYHLQRARKSHWSDTYIVRLRGRPAVDLMLALKPYMGIRRNQQIDKAIDSHHVVERLITDEQAVAIRNRFRTGESAVDLAEEFGISKWYVYAIHQGRKCIKS